ncbi:hypothetical protein F4859DRAFT_470772 [Xylaria cf. heliscus]|nr:hypothetical protein F4859DRAFT_470772 [Xylaria cf. heliscus]
MHTEEPLPHPPVFLLFLFFFPSPSSIPVSPFVLAAHSISVAIQSGVIHSLDREESPYGRWQLLGSGISTPNAVSGPVSMLGARIYTRLLSLLVIRRYRYTTYYTSTSIWNGSARLAPLILNRVQVS